LAPSAVSSDGDISASFSFSYPLPSPLPVVDSTITDWVGIIATRGDPSADGEVLIEVIDDVLIRSIINLKFMTWDLILKNK
jgi:hypothetical protein